MYFCSSIPFLVWYRSNPTCQRIIIALRSLSLSVCVVSWCLFVGFVCASASSFACSGNSRRHSNKQDIALFVGICVCVHVFRSFQKIHRFTQHTRSSFIVACSYLFNSIYLCCCVCSNLWLFSILLQIRVLNSHFAEPTRMERNV